MILLDTHCLVWFDTANPSLGSSARVVIDEARLGGAAAVSAVTFWECALLLKKGRLRLPLLVEQWHADLQALGFVELPLDGALAMASVALHLPLKDPADRFIVATALAFDATLVTADQRILDWSSGLKRHDARL